MHPLLVCIQPYCPYPPFSPPPCPHLSPWFTPGPHLSFECPTEKPLKVLEEGMLLSQGRPNGTQLRRSQAGRLGRQRGRGERDVEMRRMRAGDSRAVETGAGLKACLGRLGIHAHSCPPPHQAWVGTSGDHWAAGAPSPAVSRALVGSRR